MKNENQSNYNGNSSAPQIDFPIPWRRLRGFDYLAKVIAGVQFKDGIEVIKIDQVAA